MQRHYCSYPRGVQKQRCHLWLAAVGRLFLEIFAWAAMHLHRDFGRPSRWEARRQRSMSSSYKFLADFFRAVPQSYRKQLKFPTKFLPHQKNRAKVCQLDSSRSHFSRRFGGGADSGALSGAESWRPRPLLSWAAAGKVRGLAAGPGAVVRFARPLASLPLLFQHQ